MVVESEPIRYEIVRQVTFSRCGYTWFTRSKKQYVSCPNCRYSVKIIQEEEAATSKE